MSAGLLAFVIALLASMMLTVPVRALALRVGMVDLPGPRKVHVQPIPLLGGLAMYGGGMLALFFGFYGAGREQSVGIVTGARLGGAGWFFGGWGRGASPVKHLFGLPLGGGRFFSNGLHSES